jgi:hypothetical protein
MDADPFLGLETTVPDKGVHQLAQRQHGVERIPLCL